MCTVDSRRLSAADRPRLSSRSKARAAVVREVPAARRAPVPAQDRTGLDATRTAGGRLLHQAHGRGWLAELLSEARQRDAARIGEDGRHASPKLRRSGCATSSTTGRASPRLVGYRAILQGAPATRLRRNANRGDHDRNDRNLVGGHRPGTGDADQGAGAHARHLRARPQAPPPARQPGRRRREAADATQRQHRGLLTRGGDGARPRRDLRAGRRAIPDRRLHRTAAGRAAGAVLA